MAPMRPRGALQLALVSVLLSYSRAQDNTTCTAASCGVSSCDPGYELEVTVASDSLVISCEPCNEDYYKFDEGSEACTPCGDGLVAEVGSTVCSLEEGYWRTSNTSTVVYECPKSGACVGGSDPASYCDTGFEGRLCAVCEDDYYPSGNYECLHCTAADTAGTIIMIIVFLSCLGLFLVFVNKAAEKVVDNTAGATVDDNAQDAAAATLETGGGTSGRLIGFIKKWKDTLVVRLKIVVAHFQVVTALPKVLEVQWPQTFDRYADKMSVFNLDIWGLMTQGCYFTTDFLYQLVFTTLLPLFLVAVLLAYYFRSLRARAGQGAEAKRAVWDRTVGGILLTGFFFYIITSTVVLKSFDCYDFDDGESFMKADFSISCNSRRYKVIFWYAVVMTIVFPVGIPLIYLMVLFVGRKRINPHPYDPEHSAEQREEDPTIQKTKFLWGTYRPSVYFYEVWECVRKLLLTGLLVYFEDGSATQVVISIVITLAGLRVLSGLRPYLEEDENSLAEASLWITFLTLFVALLIKSGVTEEDGYDSTALGVLLSLINLALIALAALQLLSTTSMWFQEKLSWCCFGGGGGDNRKRPEIKSQPRRRRETAATASQALLHHQRREPSPTQAPISGMPPTETRSHSARRKPQRDGVHPSDLPGRGEKPRPLDMPVRAEPNERTNKPVPPGVTIPLPQPQHVDFVQPKVARTIPSDSRGNTMKPGPSRSQASRDSALGREKRVHDPSKEHSRGPEPSQQTLSRPDPRKQEPPRSELARTQPARPPGMAMIRAHVDEDEPRTQPADGEPREGAVHRPQSLPSRLSRSMNDLKAGEVTSRQFFL